MNIRASFALFFASAIVCASSARAEVVAIPAPYLGEGKTLRAQLFLPETNTDSSAEKSKSGAASTRRAAVMLLHGCGGIGANGQLNARHTMWKDWLIERGFIVLFPESFTSRGVEQICTQKFADRAIKQHDRVNDVQAAKAWLLARNDVDANKLVLWGWSNGGGTVLATITRQALATPDAQTERSRGAAATEPPFAQAISFYPGCSDYVTAKRSITLSAPLTLLIGEADDWTPAAPCKTFVETMRAQKQPATLTLFPEAFHDFDNPNGKIRVRKDVPNGVKPGNGVTVGPNPEAREAAKKQLDALLRDAKLIANIYVKAQ